MVKYFLNDNYLKINNKPVFLIHQPIQISNDNIKLFNEILNEVCKKNGFTGIELILDNLGQANNYKEYHRFNHQPFHHRSKNLKCSIIPTENKRIFNLDYQDYLEFLKDYYYKNDEIKVLFLSFDNTARKYFHFNKPNSETCILKP